MRKILVFLLMWMAVVPLFGQSNADAKTIISKDANTINDAMLSGDLDTILDYTYPAVFNRVDRNSMKSVFNQLFSGNDELKIEIQKPDHFFIEVVEVAETSDHVKYALVTHPVKMKMIFLKTTFEPDQYSMIENLYAEKGFKAKFSGNNALIIERTSIMIALNDKITKGTWKYVNFDEENIIYSSIIPAEVFKKAKELNIKLQQKLKEDAN